MSVGYLLDIVLDHRRSTDDLDVDRHARTSVPSSEIQGDDQSGCLSVSSSSAPPERRKVSAEVQFEVAPKTVTKSTDLGTARQLTGPGQGREEYVGARLELGSCRRPEPIDLGLHRT